MQFRFFAFGSFAPGLVHYPKVTNLITERKQAFVRGTLYRLRCGYPALIPDPSADLVEGYLYDLRAPESYWAILDELLQVDPLNQEKSFFQRLTVPVQVDNFTTTAAETYCLNPKKKTKAHKIITGGNWQKDLANNPPAHLSLQERQKQYIHKLSRSKGRDIVPIKLDLYRELMNLELIVDKGRRLALTPLGKETAFFMNL